MKKIEPYLFFNGHCEEALNFYREKLNAEITYMIRFKEMPEEAKQNAPCAEGMDDKIMHANFRIGDNHLMASDGCCDKDKTEFSGFSLSIAADTQEEGQKYMETLAEGGTVVMPYAATFWAKGFGMVQDKFGVLWMVSAE